MLRDPSTPSYLIFALVAVATVATVATVARSQESFNTTPQPIKSNFTCYGRLTGYYADVPSNCRIYHNCDDQGNKFSYHCPEMTAFRQEALICDHAHLVDCQAVTRRRLTVEKASNISEGSPVSRLTTNAVQFRDYLLSMERKPGWPADVSFGSAKSDYSSVFARLGEARYSAAGKDLLAAKKNETPRNDRGERTIVQRRFGAPFAGSIFETRTIPRRGDDGTTGPRGTERIQESTTPRCVCEDESSPATRFASRNGDLASPSGVGEVGSRSVATSAPPASATPTISSTSETPFRDYTASLEPLVPNALEYDPYYPKEPGSTTETYYTPAGGVKISQALDSPNFQPPLVGIYFKIPDVLPDLNTLDDIVDRRRLFYIPRTTKL